RQLVERDKKSRMVFRGLHCGVVCNRTFFGHGAPPAYPPPRTTAIGGLCGVLFTATSWIELVFDQPIAGCVSESDPCGSAGRRIVCRPALAESCARSPDVRRGRGDGMAV